MKKRELLILFIILAFTAVIRLWIPIPNFSPIGAIALMGGAFLGKRALAFALPLLALFLGDLILSQVSSAYSSYLFSASFAMVYLAFVVIVLIGLRLSKHMNLKNVLGTSIVAAVAFFVISNFGSWLFFGMYPMNAAGLMEAFAAGLPFFQNTLISQLVFSLGIYIAFSLSTKKSLSLV